MGNLTRKPGAKEAYYEPVGYCIYCGDDSDPSGLTDEHIIPRALGGDRILQQASCKPCQRTINHEFENYVLGKMFGVARAQLRAPFRKKKEKRWESAVERRTDSGKAPANVHVDMIPILMLEPKYVVPGILVGTPKPEQEVAVIAVQLFGSNLDRASQNKIASQTVAGAPPLFARMLAKIAHGYMVAEHHRADLEYLLPNVILGTEKAITHFVGNEQIKLMPPEGGRGTHMVKMDWRGDLAVVLIRLFVHFTHSLTYSVVAARKMGQNASTRPDTAR